MLWQKRWLCFYEFDYYLDWNVESTVSWNFSESDKAEIMVVFHFITWEI